MSDLAPPTFVLRRTFEDVDDLADAAQQWDLDFRQLECGQFHGHLLQFGVGGAQVGDARFCRSLKQCGAPPAGMRTIAIPAHGDVTLTWRGRVIDGRSAMVFPLNSELSSVSQSNFHVFTCSFSDDVLATAGEMVGVGDLDEARRGEEAMQIPSRQLSQVRRLLHQVCQLARHREGALSTDDFRRQLTSVLPVKLMEALAQGAGRCPTVAGPKRVAAVRKAETFIERHAADGISLRDLSEASGVSERTLEYAFLEQYGMGPKRFMTAHRLLAVRRLLRAADPRTSSVADAANTWGFWHMGQFAADYRRRFDELPSETLRRPPVG
ncbi:MAG: helix-turn-helix domain-containing protein [Planctomycetota bacterium]